MHLCLGVCWAVGPIIDKLFGMAQACVVCWVAVSSTSRQHTVNACRQVALPTACMHARHAALYLALSSRLLLLLLMCLGWFEGVRCWLASTQFVQWQACLECMQVCLRCAVRCRQLFA